MANSPVVALGCVANLFSRQMHFLKKGDIEHGHSHQYDHLTLLAHGSLDVIVDGKKTKFVAPSMIYIKEQKNHELIALEDNTVAYCIHALRDRKTKDILDPKMVPDGVDPMGMAVEILS